MRLTLKRLAILFLISIPFHSAFSQQTVKGLVKNASTGAPVGSASVVVKGSFIGTSSDEKGRFSLSIQSLPITLVISGVGYMTEEKRITTAGELTIVLRPSSGLGQEVVISASRSAEKILKSPVSIERINSTQIRNAPAANYYDQITNLKGVDVTTSSLTFRTPTTRGFGGSGNARFNQLVDGMDNQAPGLNFSVGSIVGLTELDVDNMELLSGASSALYGPGGMNGTLLINSKDPFKYAGLSVQMKTGVMHVDESERPASPYYNMSLRWAEKVNDKFAFKLTTELTQAKDWIGMDYRNFDRSNGVLKAGSRESDPSYDGVNVYGDETFGDLRQVLQGIAAQAPFLAPFIGTLTQNPILVSRTGFTEQQLLDPNTRSLKFGGSAHYRINPTTELSLAGYWGTGNTIYTGASRYSIKDFAMGQYKFELKSQKLMFRAYTTQEDAGESYNLAATTQNFNEAWKASGGATGWYAQYGQTWLGAKLAGMTDADAHTMARVKADSGRPELGSQAFNDLYNKIRKLPVPQGGALLDKSDVYVAEGSYDLSSVTGGFADILIGANFRQYSLNSQGTLFIDTAAPIKVWELGSFIQASKNVTDKLKLSASLRMDKNQNFKEKFTPRVTAVYEVAKNRNIRLSFQSAYRFPTNQQQFINLDLVSYKLIGGNAIFTEKYGFDKNPLYYRDSLLNNKAVAWNGAALKPETVNSFELGYRGLHADDKLLIDVVGYYGIYRDFLGRTIMVQSKTNSAITPGDAFNGNIFSIPVNASGEVITWGYALGLDYKLPKNFNLGLNLASDNLEETPSNLLTYFNAPKYKFNASFGNSGFGKEKRMGFQLQYRWQDAFDYQGDLANGEVSAFHVLDAQINYKLPFKNSMLKLGANNLLNQYYYNAVGNSRVGGLYYLGLGYNVF
jgi:outer membrane receptor protein involved in Fe transport